MIIRGILLEMKGKKVNFELIVFCPRHVRGISMWWVMTSRRPANKWQYFLFHHFIWSFTRKLPFISCVHLTVSGPVPYTHYHWKNLPGVHLYPHIKVKLIPTTIVYWAWTLVNLFWNKLWLYFGIISSKLGPVMHVNLKGSRARRIRKSKMLLSLFLYISIG